ncbi:hypothetical protein HA44_07585 [Mixta gaviniae]|nr:hypothetical protein HA44_07585 [Mixta gaviniae]
MFFGDFNSLPESKIIPFSGVIKSGAGCIIQAGGGGRRGGTGCRDAQPLTASSNIPLQAIDSRFRIV